MSTTRADIDGTATDATTTPAIRVGLVQINNSFSGQNYLPYSVAVLQAYVEQFAADPARYSIKLPIYKRMPISRIVEDLADADVVGFSTYVWNSAISLEIARRLKALKPSMVIVFGGPHVPDHPEPFLRRNDFIDIAVHNEGERAFLAILEQFPTIDRASIPGISFISSDGDYHRIASLPRIRDLDEIPSPFLSGVFDRLMAANPDEQWIGLWETNRGCPFQCTFCDWGSATAAKVNKFEDDRLRREVDWFSEKKIEYIFCCDANFGILKRDVDIATYVAEKKLDTGYPRALSVQNTKNATERAYQTQKILSDAGLNKGVALSMQSVDHETLVNIKRDNISLDTYLELQRRFTKDRVETYSDLILGLPGETYESFVQGIDKLIESGQHNRIQFNNLSILPNAEMGDPAYRERFKMETVESKIINIHGQRHEIEDDVEELQDLVVSTGSMPREDWRRARAIAWMTALLYFDKMLQIPMIVAHELTGVSFREMIEAAMATDERFPLLSWIRDFFLDEAHSIQNGGPEYVFSEEWLSIYWPADEYVFIKMTADHKMEQFFNETQILLLELIEERMNSAPTQALDDAFKLNRALVRRPFMMDDVIVNTDYDVMSFYKAVLVGESTGLVKRPVETLVECSKSAYTDFQAWCREVVWWGNKKGAYLYGNETRERQLAGHY